MFHFTIGANNFYIAHPYAYLALSVAYTAIIRVAMSLLRTIELYEGAPRYFSAVFWRDIWGRSTVPKARDRLVPFWIGTAELTIYPVLIAMAAWQPIGGWLAIKTAAGWRWEAALDSQSYMRFLFGNALVIFFSFVLATMVAHTPPPTGLIGLVASAL